MKNLPTVLSGLSLGAVAILFFLHFSSDTKSSNSMVGKAAASGLKIAYVNTDTLLKYLDYAKEVRERLEAKGKKLDADLQNRAKALETEIGAYQRNINSMTIGQAKAVEEDLGKKQQNLAVYQRRIEQEIATDQLKVTEELYGSLTTFVKKYAEQNGLEIVLKVNRESDVLFADSSLDISQDVVKGLNEEHRNNTANNPTKTDSTKTNPTK
ncbi:MAG: OmpH family outer membrane protein [Flammeovirgaceae bacterium]